MTSCLWKSHVSCDWILVWLPQWPTRFWVLTTVFIEIMLKFFLISLKLLLDEFSHCRFQTTCEKFRQFLNVKRKRRYLQLSYWIFTNLCVVVHEEPMSSAATVGIIAGVVGTVILLIVIIVGFILVRYATVDCVRFPFISCLYCVT